MQKITIEFLKNFIAANTIPFLPTQPKLCIPIISRICQKMSHAIKFDEIKVCDSLIIDGHHRYLSALITNFDLGNVQSNKTSATEPLEWNMMEFDEEDWDTPARIAHVNKLDAKYNKLEIEFVNKITSA